jgi:uncharacterized DUF497 family protein
VILAANPTGQVLLTVYTYVEAGIRIIFSRMASSSERKSYEED